jgi:hypothetical protein
MQTFGNVASNIYMLDQTGNSYDQSGVQWANTMLLNKVYPDLFLNLLTQASNKAVYTVLAGSPKPVDDYKNGIVSGYIKLAKSMKLNINANTSGTYSVMMLAYLFKRAHVTNGHLTVYE